MFSLTTLVAGCLVAILLTYLLVRSTKYVTLFAFGTMYTVVFIIVPSLRGIISPDLPAYIAQVHIDISTLYESSLLISLLGILLAVVGYMMAVSSSRLPIRNTETNGQVRIALKVSFASALVGGILMILASGMSLVDLIGSSRFSYWSTRNVWLFLIGQYLAGMAMVQAYLLGLSTVRYNRILWIGPIFIVWLGLFLFGNRAQPLGVVCAYLLGRYIRFRDESHRITVRGLLLGGVALSLVGYVSVAWQVVRWRKQEGVGAMLAELLNVKKVVSEVLFQGDAMYFFNAFIAARQLVPSAFDYLYGSTYYRLLLLPIPHTLFPSIKPEETQRIFAYMLNPALYEQGATFPPSLLGDLHLNFGTFGYFLMLPFGWVLGSLTVRMLHKPLSVVSVSIFSGLPLFLLLALRGSLMNGLTPLLSNLLLMLVFWLVRTVLLGASHRASEY